MRASEATASQELSRRIQAQNRPRRGGWRVSAGLRL